MTTLEIGDRVRAYQNAGGGFAGKIGTIRERLGAFFYVDFDHTNDSDQWSNGGTWSETSLERVELDPYAEVLRADLREADAEIARLGEYARAREAEISQHEANYSALADDYREAKAAAKALADEAEQLRRRFNHAYSLLDETGRAAAEGYAEGLIAGRL